MIQINLLPNEYRKTESTPIARFLAIVIGAILVTGGLVGYGFLHYSKLRGVREVREATQAEFTNKRAQAEVSRSLQAEHTAYGTRRKAIAQVARKRILQARKLDEFLDVIYNRGDKSAYYVWLTSLSVKPPRAVRRGQASNGGTMSFGGFSETTEFSRITNLRDAIRKDAFFDDFTSISPPVFKAVEWDDELEPGKAGRFAFDLTYKPLGWRHMTKAGAKR